MGNIKLLLAVTLLFYSCSKSPAPRESYLGKWKLMHIALPLKPDGNGHFFQPPILDFSKGNVVFEFKLNHILTISEDLMNYFDSEHELFYSHPLNKLGMGTYTYFIEPNEITFSLKIENFSIGLSISQNGSRMSWRSMGAGGYDFVKVEE